MKKILIGLFVVGSVAMAECGVHFKTHERHLVKEVKLATKKIQVGKALNKTDLVKEGALMMIGTEEDIKHVMEFHYEQMATDEILSCGEMLESIEILRNKLN